MSLKPSVVCGFALWALTGPGGPVFAQGAAPAEVSLNRGIQAFQAADYPAARAHFEAAVRQDRNLAAAHYFLGLTFLQIASQTDNAAERAPLLEWANSEFEQTIARGPDLVLAHLDGAIANMIRGRFEEAESGLRRFIESRPDDPLPYLFLAIVYFRQAEDDASTIPAALANLDRAQAALDQAPQRGDLLGAYIELYRGLVYIKQGDARRASRALEAAKNLAPGTDVAGKAADLLERIRRGELARPRWDLALQFGLDWDSNVTLRGKRTSQLFESTDDEDWRFGLGSAFNYRFVDRDDLVFGVGFNTFHSWHTDIDEFNVQTYGGSVFAGYTPPDWERVSLGLRYDFDQSLLDNDLYLQRHRVTPQVVVREADWTTSTLFYQYDGREYQYDITDPWLDRDGNTNAVGVVQDFEITRLYERPLTASVSYRFGNISTDGREFDADSHIFALGVSVPLPEDFTFEFLNEWELQYYDHRSLFDAHWSKRRDVISTFIFGLSKRFNEQWSARLHLEFTKDDSNIRGDGNEEFFSYDRAIYGISVLYQF